jgi:hypothetical protein
LPVTFFSFTEPPNIKFLLSGICTGVSVFIYSFAQFSVDPKEIMWRNYKRKLEERIAASQTLQQ